MTLTVGTRVYTWDGTLSESTPVTVTRFEQSWTVPFGRLIALTNGEILREFEQAGALS